MTRSGRWAIVFIVLFVVLSLIAAVALLRAATGVGGLRSASVLHLKLDGAFEELASHDFLTRTVGREARDMRDVLDALERAQGDRAIKGLFVEIGTPELGVAQSEEVRAAIARFRQSGKWAWAFLETAGEFQAGNGAYVLASACDHVFLAPPGDVALTGFLVETPFARGLLDKLEVVPEFGQRKEFKNAPNTYLEKDYTPAHREAMQRLIDSFLGDLVAVIARNRKLTDARVTELISGGPYTGPEAKELGLVDELVYRDEMRDRLEKESGAKDPLVSVEEYLRRGRPHDAGARRIAVVYAVGMVMRGRSSQSPLVGTVMGSDTIARALRRAREDDGVRAVVLRVDSPGGSYVASDVIRREVELTRKAKPVIVSMGNVAASGGYFISMDGTGIVADSGTITGSIGVFAGKFVTSKFWEDKLGIKWGQLWAGDNARFFSSQSDYSAEGRQRLDAMLDRIYADFTSKAARGRSIPLAQLEPLAHGRVWTGKDALDRKLIDRIGGLREAVEWARQQGGIGPEERFELVVMPSPPGLLQSLVGGDEPARVSLPPEAAELLRVLWMVRSDAPEHFLLTPGVPRAR